MVATGGTSTPLPESRRLSARRCLAVRVDHLWDDVVGEGGHRSQGPADKLWPDNRPAIPRTFHGAAVKRFRLAEYGQKTRHDLGVGGVFVTMTHRTGSYRGLPNPPSPAPPSSTGRRRSLLTVPRHTPVR
jgi:hypothetical protein